MSSKLPSYMHLRGRTIWYKRHVPKRLRNTPPFDERVHFEKSLGVHTVAEARRVIVQRGYDQLFDGHIIAVAKESPLIEVTDEIAIGLMNDLFNRSITKMHSSRASEPLEVRIQRDELAAQGVASMYDDYTGDDAKAAIKREQEEIRLLMAEGISKKHNLRNDPESLQKIADALFEVEIAELYARVDLALRNEPQKPHFAYRDSERIHHPKAYWTIEQMAEEAITQSGKKESWNHKVRVATKLFNQQVKGLPLHKVEQSHIKSFVNKIAQAPDRMVQRFEGHSLDTAITANAKLEKPYGTVSANTVNTNYFAPIRWVFAHAVYEAYLKHNPCQSVQVKGASKSKGKSRGVPFEIEELNAFFNLPTYTGCKSPDRPNVPGSYVVNDHRKWVPLVMLFTGARPSEIAQLTVKDVRSDHKYPHISILTDYDPNDPKDQDYIVTFKTENARRLLPIHPTLIQLGSWNM